MWSFLARFAVAWYPIYRISDGPLRSVFLTYHSLHHTTLNNELRCSLGQSAGPIDGLIAFPVVGLECYNTQVCAVFHVFPSLVCMLFTGLVMSVIQLYGKCIYS